MKRVKYFLLMASSIAFFQCTSEEELSPKEQEQSKLLEKVEYYKTELFYDQTYFYNSQNQIDSIVTNRYRAASFKQVISVQYINGEVNSITETIDYDDPNRLDQETVYDITVEENKISLISDITRNTVFYADGYVDRVLEYFSDSLLIKDSHFERDSKNNLIKLDWQNWGNINYYSNFDVDKKPDPHNFLIDPPFREYIHIFGLKFSNNNPQSRSQGTSDNEGRLYEFEYEYDEEGYVTKIMDSEFKDLNYLVLKYKTN